MITDINIDVSEFAEMFSISEQEVKVFTDNVIGELAIEFAQNWEIEADELGSTKQKYKDSIFREKIANGDYVVGLRGFMANAVENGLQPFDEKVGFSRSGKKKKSKSGGWYLTIPFRLAVPSAIGENSTFSGVMPSKVYKAAQNLAPKQSLKKGNLPKEFQGTTKRDKVVTKSKIFEEYQRKHSIYEGINKSVDNKGRGTYNTFRRVSDKSDPNSWIHTGIEAHNLAEKALSNMNVPDTVDHIARKYIDELV